MSDIANIQIDESGRMRAIDQQTHERLKDAAGIYRGLWAGKLLVLSMDEATGAAPQPGEKLALAGDVAHNSLLSLLNLFGQNRETGRLVIRWKEVERVIMLKQGDVASVGSNAPEDRLGQFLVRMGKVTDRQLDDASREADATGRRIGQVLIAGKLLDAHELWSTIQSQIMEIFADVVSWEQGSFVLYRVAEEFRFPSTPPISMQALLMESVRRADEMNVYREKIRDMRVRLQPTGKALRDDAEQLELSALRVLEERRIMSVADLAKALVLTEFDVTRIAHLLLKHKVATVDDLVMPISGSFELSPQNVARIEVYNLAFREIRDEVVRAGHLESFQSGVKKYLSDPDLAHGEIFQGLTLDATGGVPVDGVRRNLAKVEHAEPIQFLSEGMNELTFFMLFQAGEVLDTVTDENLGRRVRLIHAALASQPA